MPTFESIPHTQRWIPETRFGRTVGWLVIDENTGQIVRVIRYESAQ